MGVGDTDQITIYHQFQPKIPHAPGPCCEPLHRRVGRTRTTQEKLGLKNNNGRTLLNNGDEQFRTNWNTDDLADALDGVTLLDEAIVTGVEAPTLSAFKLRHWPTPEPCLRCSLVAFLLPLALMMPAVLFRIGSCSKDELSVSKRIRGHMVDNEHVGGRKGPLYYGMYDR